MTKYKIVWYSKETEYQGEGEDVFHSESEAKRVCDEQNAKYLYLVHEVVEVQS